MPYITQAERQVFERALTDLGEGINTAGAGTLTYLLSMVCRMWVLDTDYRYEDLNAVIGALETTKQEFYRRMLVPYEDAKIAENGDVY